MLAKKYMRGTENSGLWWGHISKTLAIAWRIDIRDSVGAGRVKPPGCVRGAGRGST